MKPLPLHAFADRLVLHFLTAQAAGQLRESNREQLAAGVVKLLEKQFATEVEVVTGCSICEQPLVEPALELADGVVTCARCGRVWVEAVHTGGTVLRFRCSPTCSPAPATCGRVIDVQLAPGRAGPIVADSSTCCDDCRPAQTQAMERVLGADARRRRGEGGSDARP